MIPASGASSVTTEPHPRFTVGPLPQPRTHWPPKLKDFVRKVRPAVPGIQVASGAKRAMLSSALIGQDISLAIAVEISSGNPAMIYSSLSEVSLHPPDLQTRVKGKENPLLQASVRVFRFHCTLAITDNDTVTLEDKRTHPHPGLLEKEGCE
eukprot:2878281-Amphidinium_carterae.2